MPGYWFSPTRQIHHLREREAAPTYAPVNGLQLCYEVRGSGRPIVLLHGGLLTIDLNFGPLLAPLAGSFRAMGTPSTLTAR
jgi:hypothetical protein